MTSIAAALEVLDFSLLDGGAVALLAVCWGGFNAIVLRTRSARWASLSRTMVRYRFGWMTEMVGRDMRMIDTMIQGSVLQGCTFFASTAILLVGGLIALLGATDRALGIVQDLPFAAATTQTLWELKVLLLITVLVYAFFKFAWAHRLYTYCIVVMGAAPTQKTEESPRFARRAARLLDLGALHFDRGIRAYYYTLAATAWFVHPIAFMVSTLWVTAVLLRREFRSRTRTILLAAEPD